MAEKMNITRAKALAFAIRYIQIVEDSNAIFDDEQLEMYDKDSDEVCAVLNKMLDSISKPRAKQVSKARIGNENLAHKLWDASESSITTKDATEKGIPEIMTTQKAAAVLRVGVELGLFEKVSEGKKVSYRKIG